MTGTPPASQAAAAGPGFADARGCKEWLNAIPLTNIPHAQQLVLDMLRGLNAAAFDPLGRLKCLELVRDKVAFLQGEQRSRYFGKSLPLSPNDSAAWQTGATVLAELELGYRRCVEDAPAAEALAAHRPLVLQRIVRYLGARMLFHAIVYRRFDAELWSRVHRIYADAEAAGLAGETVKDSLDGGDDGVSSVTEAYVRVVLLQAAYLSELTAPQMDLAEALLARWARKVRIVGAAAGQGLPHALAVDLDKPLGARSLAGVALGPTHRVLDVEGVSKSLRKRIHGLQNDEEPAKVGLPAQAAGLDALAQLKRLHKLWCEGALPRPPAKASELQSAGVVFTPSEIHFFVSGGKEFEQPGGARTRELTSQEKQDMEVFGRVTERTHNRMKAEHNYTVEAWAVVDEMPGTWRLQRPASASKGVGIGRLAAVRLADAGPFYLAMVAALVQETDGRIIATFALFPGRPEPLTVRAVDARKAGAGGPWSQGFRLPALERLQIPASLVVPSGVGVRGRGVEIWEAQPREATVHEVLERGADFDRIVVS